MKKIRRYEIEGVLVEIPVHYDEDAGIYIEDYPDFIANSIWTPEGFRIMFVGEDACLDAKEITAGGCIDCGSCIFYRPAAEHTWFGVCTNKKRRRSAEQTDKINSKEALT